MAASDLTQINALDPNSLSGLRRLSRDRSPEATKEAAKQFEALLLQQVLKSMRDATPKGGMFDNEQTKMYQSMLDQQLSLQLATRSGGLGLARVIERQLGGDKKGLESGVGELPELPAKGGGLDVPSLGAGLSPPARPATIRSAAIGPAESAGSVPAGVLSSLPAGSAPRAFVEKVWPQAVEASKTTGIPARFLVAQAALETGWGKHELKHADGSGSHNLFNIKAGRSWAGNTVETATTEYLNGVKTRENAQFRAYGSYAESFRDYARLIRNNPRYAALVGEGDAAAFARGLQAAGYATDPQYADKLTRIINGNTLRLALAGDAPSRG
ncbi:flagellar assembly peptidoglycan hydrolase FlgJ [Zoogloea sp.]|uniref:flagellar assembly peptidoglycan hydrolase FlgJ n=1 Tax=Zoogloea sp. TaxID=49181 RepID=UPI0026391BE4|nr:flagellar assembly peptidoglycan hydrolase FlgJ [Zoogloea sp.]MDD3352786.1 flagellar assembly peptidoglycan hydrolase FlgJ [Zoogloea sp.]